jgi:hypothetical protein
MIDRLGDIRTWGKRKNDFKNIVFVVEEIYREYDNSYGSMIISHIDNSTQIELITGGWSENEAVIEAIQESMFWTLYWEESKRGGYYKFIVPEIITISI